MERITKAIILAAGEGHRLRPVTLNTPKPLVKVNGIRLIDTIIGALKKNGIHEIYIVTGYKKEQFHEVYKADPDITILDNPHYLDGNNITSLYVAKNYLSGTFIVEGDLLIANTKIFDPLIEKSGYVATYMEHTPEWALTLSNGSISSCNIEGGEYCYRLWGVSMWTKEDGARLAELVTKQIEVVKDWNMFWDELALSHIKDIFSLGIREAKEEDICEIDTFEELMEIDPSYKDYNII